MCAPDTEGKEESATSGQEEEPGTGKGLCEGKLEERIVLGRKKD